jgi:hypothetical protein
MGREAGLTSEQMTRLQSMRTEVNNTFAGMHQWLLKFARLRALLKETLGAHEQHLVCTRHFFSFVSSMNVHHPCLLY